MVIAIITPEKMKAFKASVRAAQVVNLRFLCRQNWYDVPGLKKLFYIAANLLSIMIAKGI